MKKTKEIVLYDDTENYKKFDETRDFLFEVYAKKISPTKQSTKKLTFRTKKRGEI